ncbi:hypothetical protein [Streptomyces cavernicola]|uniref:Uncharacterized protein n=1 Tax=Streptomyces cavernicola TaxID=3043613 RepID=A0ABT6SBN8_9ACTN|nr:hypothetical protein [Streptomyces sp. B-S-A6]MDI3404711.1 hypothetical protein [Streptomyces sp. B-S-A6]
MSPLYDPLDRTRSAAELNAEIRALWPQGSASLSGEQRAEYERLVVRWSAQLAYERLALDV